MCATRENSGAGVTTALALRSSATSAVEHEATAVCWASFVLKTLCVEVWRTEGKRRVIWWYDAKAEEATYCRDMGIPLNRAELAPDFSGAAEA